MAKYLQLQPTLMPHQMEFYEDDRTSLQAFVGGYRSGKSYSACWKALKCASVLFPGKEGLILAPVAGMNQTNILPIMRKILPTTGLSYDAKKLNNEYVNSLEIYVGDKVSKIWFDSSAENSSRYAGRSLAWGYFDEADLCRNADLAYKGFMQLKARLSEAEYPLLFTTSTPEGFGFMYRKFVEEADENTKIWHVSMEDNFLLPKGYVGEQLKNIPKAMHSAYVKGLFANIHTATVYPDYDRDLNNTHFTVADRLKGEPLHIGMDFNIEHMAGIVHIERDGLPYAVDELVNILDVPTMIGVIKRKYPNTPIIVYPDAAGKSRTVTGIDTAHSLLQQAGFKLKVNPSHPAVGDRINSVNVMFCNVTGERRYKVNSKLCPTLVKSLERQSYIKGEPDKSNNIDHPLDAMGYYINWQYPLQGRITLRTY